MPDRPLLDGSVVPPEARAACAMAFDHGEVIVATLGGRGGKGVVLVTDRRIAIYKNDLLRWWAHTELTGFVVQSGFTNSIALAGPGVSARHVGNTDVAYAPHALQVVDKKRAQLVAAAANELIANPTAVVADLSQPRVAGFRLDGALFVARAPGGYIALWDDHIRIKPMGLMGFTKGIYKGDKEIPIDQITAIQWREPHGIVSGHIQFTIMGGSSDSKSGSRDENSMMFEGATRDDFAQLKLLIEERMARFRAARLGVQTAPAAPDIPGQIRKLADLHAAGILTDEEFTAKKAELLARL